VTHARITFKNEATGEYTFYELKYSAAAPAPQGNLMLECPVRTVTSTRISIANPLDTAVTLKSTISSKQVGPWGNLGRRGRGRAEMCVVLAASHAVTAAAGWAGTSLRHACASSLQNKCHYTVAACACLQIA
jgi:hypothetical protein